MIQTKNLTLSRSHKALVKDLNCQFESGQIWGIIGRNGTGKSTLLHTLSGLHPPSAGQIAIDGQDLNTLNPLDRARKLTLLLQEQEPAMACTVREAVQMGRFAWPELGTDCEDILRRCQITDLAEQNILTLSGGERRKVEMATCMAQPSPYWLLDEPLNHLDVVYQKHAIKLISEHAEVGCVIMICHDLNVIKTLCTHVLMLYGEGCYQFDTSATMMNQHHLDQLFYGHTL